MQDAVFALVVSLLWMGAATPCLAADSNQPATAPQAVPEAPAASSEQPNEIIKSIEFEGNHKFKDHVLRERLGFQLGDRLDPYLAEGGRLTIAEVYRKIGYASVQVTLDQQRMAEGRLLYIIDEGPRARVASIEFVGNESFGAGTLRQIIKTKQKKWLLWPSYYTEEAIDDDVDRLREFYYNHGFLDYQIEAKTEFSADGTGVYVTFLIEEGPVYHIGEIQFTGNTRFTREQLRQWIEMREGQVYLKPVADRDAKGITQRYREQGFVDADVRQTPRFTPKTGDNLVTVELDITEGRQFRLGRIEVTGNEQTQDKAVRHVLDEYNFTPGELYNGKIAPKEGGGQLEKYVQHSVAAQEVLIRPVAPPDGDPNCKGARVNIQEGTTGMIMPGIGVSTDSGVVGRLVFQQRNFDIADWPESLKEFFSMKSFRGAGQTLSLTLEPGTQYSQYYVNFTDPYWRDRPVELDVGGRLWERYRESYDEKRVRGDIGFERRLQNRWRRSIGFRAENVGVSNLDFDAPKEIRDWEGKTQLFGARFGLGEAVVDDLYNPAQGHRFGAFYEQVAGDDAFGLLEGSYVQYFKLYQDVLDRKTVLSIKLLAGTVVGDAPPFEKYYAGGSGRYGMRGFEYRGVSTRGLQTNVLYPERKDPIGSDWIFLAGAELLFPLVGENFSGLLFLDSGTVDTGRYRLSIGAGIQILVPQIFGEIPMRFEFGVPLIRDEDDETQLFNFSQPGF
jgi:outer membrane protein insertion porin family